MNDLINRIEQIEEAIRKIYFKDALGTGCDEMPATFNHLVNVFGECACGMVNHNIGHKNPVYVKPLGEKL